MTRKLIAFLALLSGLAALGSPATASYAHANSLCDASVSAVADPSASGEQERAALPVNTVACTGESSALESHAPEPQELPKPVLMGIDRAYE